MSLGICLSFSSVYLLGVDQEREQYTDALKAVKGPMGEAFNLEGERELVEARLQVSMLVP